METNAGSPPPYPFLGGGQVGFRVVPRLRPLPPNFIFRVPGLETEGSGAEKQPKPKVFGRVIPRTSGRISRPEVLTQKLTTRPEGADVHDPRGSQKNSMQGNFGMIFHSLRMQGSPPDLHWNWRTLHA